MEEPISLEEAARALKEVEASRQRMREVIRAHHGHYHLWLWGVILSIECLGTQFAGPWFLQWPSLWATVIGMLGSCLIGFLQSHQFRKFPDGRFLSVVAMIIVFHLGIIPRLVGWPHDIKTGYVYSLLMWTEIYIVAGLWFDSFLIWSGISMGLFALLGLWLFPAFFWWWCAVFVGGSLIASGFYVRYFWR